jgi:hypothetical protein
MGKNYSLIFCIHKSTKTKTGLKGWSYVETWSLGAGKIEPELDLQCLLVNMFFFFSAIF